MPESFVLGNFANQSTNFLFCSLCTLATFPWNFSLDLRLQILPTLYFACRGFCKVGSAVINGTQKPLLHLEYLLRICHQGGWVLDLCCGSGSGVLAALCMGQDAMGVDVSKGQLTFAHIYSHCILAQVEGTTARVNMFAAEGNSCYSTANGYAFLTFCFYLHLMVGLLLAKCFVFLTHCYGSLLPYIGTLWRASIK